MQADNGDYPRHQLVDALGQCGQQLRNTAIMLDNYAAFIQNLPPSAVQVPVQNTFHMFTPPQSAPQQTAGAPAPLPPNGVPFPAVAPAPKRGRKRRGAEDQTEPADGKKRRKRGTGEKKVKDPDAPKRPPSAYLIFQNEVRSEMKQLYPDISYHDVLHKISERWSKMIAEEKKLYVDEMNQKKAKFEVAKAAYDASHGIQNGAGPATEGSAASPTTPASVPAAGAVILTASAVPSVPVAAPPAPVPALADSEDEDDEASSGADVSGIIDDLSSISDSTEEQSTKSNNESPSPSDLGSSEEQSAPAPTRDIEKPPSKTARTTYAPVKPASTTKTTGNQEKRGKK